MSTGHRYKITTSPKRFGYVAAVIGVLIVFDSFYQIFKYEYSTSILIKMLLGGAIAIVPYLLTKSMSHLEFDDEILYIVGDKHEEIILLRNILKIERTSIMNQNNQRTWKIKYRENGGGTNSMEIKVSSFSSFDTFLSNVQSVNSEVQIQKVHHS